MSFDVPSSRAWMRKIIARLAGTRSVWRSTWPGLVRRPLMVTGALSVASPAGVVTSGSSPTANGTGSAGLPGTFTNTWRTLAPIFRRSVLTLSRTERRLDHLSAPSTQRKHFARIGVGANLQPIKIGGLRRKASISHDDVVVAALRKGDLDSGIEPEQRLVFTARDDPAIGRRESRAADRWPIPSAAPLLRSLAFHRP